jgi:Family of unknown function (DUF5677)
METRPDAEQLNEISHTLIDVAYVRLPVRIAGDPVPDTDRVRRYTPLVLDEENGHRYWMSAIYTRAVMAFESTVLLANAGLDPDARAHLRIMFDYFVAFAWLGAEPATSERAFRLARYGSGFREKLLMEVAVRHGSSDELIDELALALEINEKVKPPPSIKEMCRENDAFWKVRMSLLGEEGLFSEWFTLVYRGASGFLHVTPAGIDSVVQQDESAFVIDRTTVTINRVLEIGVGLMTALLFIAEEAAPWLVDMDAFGSLQDVVPWAAHPPSVDGE